MLFNLSLDDFAPYYNSGLYFESIYKCKQLVALFPAIKINLFVPAAFCRLGETPCYLTRFPEWVRAVNDLPKNNFQIGLHGMYHRRSKEDFNFHGTDGNNDEFKDLSYDETNIIIDSMIKEVDTAGLVYAPVFRPSRWSISYAAAKALNDRGFIISSLEQHRFSDIKWISPTWDMRSDAPKNMDLFVCGHTSNWTSNYLNDEKVGLIRRTIESGKYDFVFLV